AWFAGGVTTNRSAVPTPVTTRPPIDVRGAELATEVSHLHDRLQPLASPRQPARNLFRFHARTPARAAAPAAAPLPPPEPPPPPPVSPRRLVGMAENPGPDGPLRIAYISAEGQLFDVKEGDTLLQKYRVTKISADVVELTDTVDNSVRRLALR